MRAIKVLIVDDNETFLRAAALTLNALPGVALVGAVQSGPEALPIAIIEQPDLLLLDVNMPVMDGFRTALRMRAQGVTAKIVFVSLDEAPQALAQERDVAYDGFVAKAHFAGEVQRVIEALFPSRSAYACGKTL